MEVKKRDAGIHGERTAEKQVGAGDEEISGNRFVDGEDENRNGQG